MKKFQFPLEKLRAWRETQFDVEEGKLQQLVSRLCEVQSARMAFAQRVAEERKSLGASVSVMSADLLALDRWLKFSVQEEARIKAQEDSLTQEVEAQQKVVVAANQKLEILNQFKEERKELWKREISVQQEEMVAELVVSRWKGHQS